MTDDLLVRLRNLATAGDNEHISSLAAQAADEIERLRADIMRLDAHRRKLAEEHLRHSRAVDLHRARADQQTSRAVRAERQLERLAWDAERLAEALRREIADG